MGEDVTCVYNLDIQGTAFREMQLAVEHHDFLPRDVAVMAALNAARGKLETIRDDSQFGGGHKNYATVCPAFMAAGVVQLETSAPPSYLIMTFTFDTLGSAVNTVKRMPVCECIGAKGGQGQGGRAGKSGGYGPHSPSTPARLLLCTLTNWLPLCYPDSTTPCARTRCCWIGATALAIANSPPHRTPTTSGTAPALRIRPRGEWFSKISM
jgi:hypothetical protein